MQSEQGTVDMGHEPKLRIGVVGLGMAGALMVSVIREHARTVLGAVAEPNAELRRRFEADHDVPAYDGIETLLGSGRVDAVYIATPHQHHRQHALLAASAGKHIVVEKPMALSLGDCDAMIESADRHGVVLIVGHTHSFDPAVRLMRELVASGLHGRLRMLMGCNYTDFLYRPRRPEELDTSKGGGILFNQIPHQIDVVRYLVGTPLRSLRAATGMLDPRRPTEGCCSVFLDFEDGAYASLSYSGYDRFDTDEWHGWIGEGGYPRTPVHGATARAWEQLGGAEAEARARIERYGYGGSSAPASRTPKHQPHFGVLVASCEGADLRQSADGVLVYSRDGVTEIPLPKGASRPGRSEVLDELVAAVRDGTPPPHDGRFARGTVEASLAVLRSAQERREIVL